MKKKIVFIGSSIVNGFPHKRSECFVSLIREETGYEVINKGKNGEASAARLARFDKDVIQHKPDVVAITLGTNDFIYEEATPAEVLEYLKKMTAMAHDVGAKVMWMIPLLVDVVLARAKWMADAGVDYEAVNAKLAELGNLMQEYGTTSDVVVLDLQALYFGFVDAVGSDVAYCDGVHPTVIGHRFLASAIEEVMASTASDS